MTRSEKNISCPSFKVFRNQLTDSVFGMSDFLATTDDRGGTPEATEIEIVVVPMGQLHEMN